MELHRVEYSLVFLLSLVLLFALLFSRMEEISSFAFARKLIVSALTSTTYNAWISEVKDIAVRSRVWEYVDPEGSEPESLVPKYLRFFDFVKVVSVSVLVHISASIQGEYRLSASAATVVDDVSPPPILVLEPCSDYEDLFESQKRSYDAKERAYRHIQNEVGRAMIGIEKVHTIILKFVKDYVAMNMRVCLVKKILQFLARKFKKISEDIQRQIDRRYDDLRGSHLVKGKIEQ
jgi:hypothetical protein